MIKWFGITAALLLMVGLSACSGGDSSSSDDTSSDSGDAATAAPAEAPSEGSDAKMDMDAAKASGDAVVATLTSLEAQTVGVACGVCVYGMEGEGCPVAAEIGNETYFIQFADGTDFDTHGKDLCESDVDAQAIVTGELKDGVLVVTSLELIGD